jgi:hypothetical protein
MRTLYAVFNAVHHYLSLTSTMHAAAVHYKGPVSACSVICKSFTIMQYCWFSKLKVEGVHSTAPVLAKVNMSSPKSSRHTCSHVPSSFVWCLHNVHNTAEVSKCSPAVCWMDCFFTWLHSACASSISISTTGGAMHATSIHYSVQQLHVCSLYRQPFAMTHYVQ